MPDRPSKQEMDRQRSEFASGLLCLKAQLAPLFDAADGIRADMEQRGWSPTACEGAALVWLQGMLATTTGQIGRAAAGGGQ